MPSENRLWWARLVEGSPHYADWLSILGTADVPLASPELVTVQLGDEPANVYLLDVNRLSAVQFDRLVEAMAQRFQTPRLLVRDGILKDGNFPIRSADVSVSFSMRAFL